MKTDLSFLSPEIAALVQPILEGPTCDVAFDADGTLWRDDIGEAFLQRLDEYRLLPNFPNGGAWNVYQSLYVSDPYRAYEFSATVMAGMPAWVVAEAAEQRVELFLIRSQITQMTDLLQLLKHRGHRVWIVSASNVWCVRAAAKLLGIRPERVLGIDLLQESGILLPVIKRPAPIGPGKADAMKVAGFLPKLAAGNSVHDRALLESAEVAFMVTPANAPDSDALELANLRNWPVLRV